MTCLHCQEPKPLVNRGLCNTCYRTWRHLYPAEAVAKPLDPAREVCCHCHERNAVKNKRGLCARCWMHHRGAYQMRRAHYENDETLEELEALIAERSKNLPKWWHKQQAPHGDGSRGESVPVAVLRGRGTRARAVMTRE